MYVPYCDITMGNFRPSDALRRAAAIPICKIAEADGGEYGGAELFLEK